MEPTSDTPAPNSGAACPKCGYHRSRVQQTKHVGTCTIRTRKCHRCGHRFRTDEIVFQTTAPTRKRKA